MAKHAAEENMVEMEETEMERKRREAEPVVVPTHTNLLPTTYHHLAGAYPVYYNNPYLTYPIHQVRSSHTLRRHCFAILAAMSFFSFVARHF